MRYPSQSTGEGRGTKRSRSRATDRSQREERLPLTARVPPSSFVGGSLGVEAGAVDLGLELALLEEVALAFSFGATVQASVRFSLLLLRELGLALAKLVEIDDFAHAAAPLRA